MLELRNITKRYPGTTALSDVSLTVAPGEVLALAGENGSGKSTLMKILAGHVRPDAGEILVDGNLQHFRAAADSVGVGIGLVEQELAVAADLTVGENILLGQLPRRRLLPGSVHWKRVWERAREVMDLLEIDVDPRATLGSLPVNVQQLVSIASVLSRRPRFMLLDEATSSLSEEETGHLLSTVRALRDRGMGIVLISHRMREMRDVADRILVLRDGSVSGGASMDAISDSEVVRLLVGRELEDIYPERTGPGERVVLRAEGVTAGFIHDASLMIRQGEIAGLAGLVGSGRSTLSQALFGAVPVEAGTIEVEGIPMKFRHPAEALNAGIAIVGENRKTQGILRGRSVRENLSITTMQDYSRAGLLSVRHERRATTETIRRMGIKCADSSDAIETLSGGNQQKVLLARALARNPRLLILDEPTRGVDIGAKSEIYGRIAAAAAEGTSFLIASSEMPELLGLCHTIYVMSQGRVVGRLEGPAASEESIAAMAFHSAQPMEVS